MAHLKETAANAADSAEVVQLEQTALQLFVERSSRGFIKRGMDVLAANCFQDAAAFLNVAKKVRAGEVSATEKVSGPQLADASAPNLKPTHPLNLVSKVFAPKHGGLDRVRKIFAALEADKSAEEYSDGNIEWGREEVATARTIFPHYVGAAA